jgi:hypothetical protein
MKKFLMVILSILILLSLFIFRSVSHASEDEPICSSISKTAKKVMQKRQANVPMEKLVQIAKTRRTKKYTISSSE